MEEFKIKKIQIWQGVCVLLIITLIFSIITNGFKFTYFNKNNVKTKAEKFFELTLADKGTFQINEFKENKGLYFLSGNLNGKEFNSYLSQDGSLLFPYVIELDKIDTKGISNELTINTTNK